MKIIITGRGNAQNLGRMLGYYGVEVKMLSPIPRLPRLMGNFDISLIMGVGFKTVIKSRFLPGKKVYRFQGTDAHRLNKKTKTLLKILEPPILYASERLREIVDLPGEVIPTPVDTKIFDITKRESHRQLDILYYCPQYKEDIYRIDKLKEYLASHPIEKATIVGGEIPHQKMPSVYRSHKKYLRWTTHDANPKMPYEALLCGCEVWYNDERITEIPDFMLMENTIPRFISYFEKIQKHNGDFT